MNYLYALCALALFSLPLQASQTNTEASRLIDGCRELVSIYDKRDELRFAAAQLTSLSEAMRAGYCRGVLDEYQRKTTCNTNDWREQANTIAGHAFEQEQDVDALLADACGR